MNPPSDLATVLVLLAAAIVMFAIGKPRLDAGALLTLVLLPFTGVITLPDALAGFSDPNLAAASQLQASPDPSRWSSPLPPQLHS